MAKTPEKPNPKMYNHPYVADFWGQVQKREPNQCWPWNGPIGHEKGRTYGLFRTKIGYCMNQRYVYITHNKIGDLSVKVLSLCRDELCCNPAHIVEKVSESRLRTRRLGKKRRGA
jgi:hypothetical protein